MTGQRHDNTAQAPNSREFHREQLSAMLDGALSADETRFLLRRMEHDDDLADCWQRWQFYGDAMRGHAGRALPADFSRRVGRAIADDQADMEAAFAQSERNSVGGARRSLLRWGGGAALAASVALAAFLVGRNPISTGAPGDAPMSSPQIAATPSAPSPAAQQPLPIPIPGPQMPTPAQSDPAVALVAATATAAAATTESRRQHPRLMAADAATDAGRARAPIAASVSAGRSGSRDVASAARGSDMRSSSAGDIAPGAQIVIKPWPRSLVPGAGEGGSVAAGFGALQPLSSSLPASSPVDAPAHSSTNPATNPATRFGQPTRGQESSSEEVVAAP